MKRAFIASVLSLSLAATTISVAPARANEDVLKVIAGLAVIGAIAKIHNDKKKQQVSRSHKQPVYQQPQRARKAHRPQGHAKVAPQQCLRSQWTHRGERQVYGARCIQQNARVTLPQNCLRQSSSNSGPRYFYTQRCLSNHGWRI